MGIFEIRTPDQVGLVSSFIQIRIGQDSDGFLRVNSVDVLKYKLNQSIPYINILRKWNKFCISYDFEENQAQVSINENHSPLYKNPDSDPNMKESFDAKSILEAPLGTELILSFGRYPFDNRW